MSKVVPITAAPKRKRPRHPSAPPVQQTPIRDAIFHAFWGALTSAMVSLVIGAIWQGGVTMEREYWREWVAGDIAKSDAKMIVPGTTRDDVYSVSPTEFPRW